MRVYHGSNMKVDKIDLSKCKPNKDFGKGFYVYEKDWTDIYQILLNELKL